ncbi:NDP-hexose 2,3-dehydratase family protein [Nannocystaceae bacterium ST9]
MTLRDALLASRDAEVDGSLPTWLHERRAAAAGRVELVELDRLRDWSLDREGRLVHASGRFFAIHGFEVERERGRGRELVTQPLIGQSEIGLLGVLLRVVEGRAELLIQAKREPGDPRGAQLAPTVQATISNSSRVHGGRATRGLAYFQSPRPEALVFDADQPEQADLFFAKRNRNMIVRVDDAPEFADEPDFRWVTLAELAALLGQPEAVNMSLRSVLACVAALCLDVDPGAADSARAWLATLGAGWSGWSCWSWRAREHPLDRLPGWNWTAQGLIAQDERPHAGLRVVHVEVEAPRREIASWSQPMLTRRELGRVALDLRRRAGGPEVLLRATLGPGQPEGVRLGASLHRIAASEHDAAPLGAELRFESTLAEDGGRLLAIRHRYQVFEHDHEPPAEGRWVRLAALPILLAEGRLDIELRTCLAALVLACPDLIR